MQLTHRRREKPADKPKKPRAPSSETRVPRCQILKASLLLLFAIAIALVLARWRKHANHANVGETILWLDGTAPDDELAITAGVLSREDAVPPRYDEQVMACMPTVRRIGVEYVSNAVKSWRLATNGSIALRHLAVFDMDESASSSHRPHWLHRVFVNETGADADGLPSWLSVHAREGAVRAPLRHTLGDSDARVAWRAKEAQDYAQVLRRCGALASGAYLLVVQDDVLFTAGMADVAGWAERTLVVRESTDMRGRRQTQRVCGGALFDLASGNVTKEDGHLLQSSNMVARLWRLDFLHRLAQFVDANFDDAPVDWLTDRLCKNSRRATRVMQPNPVRHRGAVSSFADNHRKDTLT